MHLGESFHNFRALYEMTDGCGRNKRFTSFQTAPKLCRNSNSAHAQCALTRKDKYYHVLGAGVMFFCIVSFACALMKHNFRDSLIRADPSAGRDVTPPPPPTD
ncbi:hypothetical protein EVAR_57346_1 [Eumeta japonica]|uniref:Uncharacterized protein n=1 Tax=Eumeta variegata TaxID=151549 RepID=A0A4C1Z814_EUMVA|nr:hypothetical protein EVAR_57346_1 [Eumeta japonica]